MNELRLSRKAQALLGLMYEQYTSRCKMGVPIRRAKAFGNAESVKNQFGLVWTESDVSEVCGELSRKGLLNVLFLDNEVGECALEDDAIVLMENKFSDDAAAFLDWLGKIRAVILG